MFRSIAFGALLALLSNGAAAEPASLAQQFAEFKVKYGRKYKSAAEEAARFAVFAENVAKAAELQRRSKHATFGVTKFSDRTVAEMHPHTGRTRKPKAAPPPPGAPMPELPAAPPKIDWRAKGAVNPVKDRGHCGAGWAFGAIAAAESANFIKNDQLVSMSEQQLVSGSQSNFGCNGGYAYLAVTDMIEDFGGMIATEESYRYVSGNGLVPPANQSVFQDFGTQLVGYSMWGGNISEDDMAKYVAAHGPIAIACDSRTWASYTGGVVDGVCGQIPNDEAAIVGYDDTAPVPYWIVRNAWGSDWGENGYIFIAKGVGECGVAQQPLAVLVGKPFDSRVGRPMPVAAQPPAAAVNARSSVTQTYCNGRCTNVDCQAYTYPLDTCLQMSGKSAMIISGPKLWIVQFQDDHCGTNFPGGVEMSVQTCTTDGAGLYYTNTVTHNATAR